jgi:hypothetical protein
MLQWLIFGVGLLLLVAYLWPRFSRRRAGFVRVVVYDGQVMTGYRGQLDAGGVTINSPTGKVTYPSTAARPVQVGIGRPDLVYIVGIESLALAEHTAMEFGRQGIVFGHLFRPGGDWTRYLHAAAVLVPLVVVIWIGTQFAAFQSSMVSQAAAIQHVSDVVSKPLVVDTGAIINALRELK